MITFAKENVFIRTAIKTVVNKRYSGQPIKSEKRSCIRYLTDNQLLDRNFHVLLKAKIFDANTKIPNDIRDHMVQKLIPIIFIAYFTAITKYNENIILKICPPEIRKVFCCKSPLFVFNICLFTEFNCICFLHIEQSCGIHFPLKMYS